MTNRNSAFILVILLMSVFATCGDNATGPGDPTLEIDPTDLQFNQQEGVSTSAKLIVSNRGKGTLRVDSITVDISWISVIPSAFDLDYGESKSIRITANWAGIAQGNYYGVVTIYSNDPEDQMKTVDVLLSVTQPFAPAIFTTPPSVYKSVIINCGTHLKLLVVNGGLAELEVFSIVDDREWMTVSPTEIRVPPQSSRQIILFFNADGLAQGTYSGLITITSNDPNEEFLDIPVRLTVNIPYLTMKSIHEGTFHMGSVNFGEDERPVHEVTLSAFYIATHEITQAQYQEIMGTNPSFYQGENLPVESVSKWDVCEFCNRLSENEGLTAAYYQSDVENLEEYVRINRSANGYRLPTEAEWEYVCRAGSTQEYYWGDMIDDDYCWFDGNSANHPHEVGTRLPNAWGLYDMSGNVFEMCNDTYADDYYTQSPAHDPIGPTEDVMCSVARGGSWNSFPGWCSSAKRYNHNSRSKDKCVGFRPVRRNDSEP